MEKKNLAIIFGGKSAEHEVSILSARNIAAAIDRNLYRVFLVGISRRGDWYLLPNEDTLATLKKIETRDGESNFIPVGLFCKDGKPTILSLTSQNQAIQGIVLDVAFPVLHGTCGEDGAPQGLFKMSNLPFVGCGILSSAVGMDKEVMKRLLQVASVPVARYQVIKKESPSISFNDLVKDLGLPLFIKPANAGSSVGVHKVKNATEFDLALRDAFLYDTKVLVEEFCPGKEIECSVMGLSSHPKASLPGEVIPQHEFYSYQAKYLDENGALFKIPAELDPSTTEKIREAAIKTFKALECDGMTRVDFFLKQNGELIVNEVNTIPGFTKISMYPKMWEATGVSYKSLVAELLDLACKKHSQEQALKIDFDIN